MCIYIYISISISVSVAENHVLEFLEGASGTSGSCGVKVWNQQSVTDSEYNITVWYSIV